MTMKLLIAAPAWLLSIALASTGLAQNVQPPRGQTEGAGGPSTAQTSS